MYFTKASFFFIFLILFEIFYVNTTSMFELHGPIKRLNCRVSFDLRRYIFTRPKSEYSPTRLSALRQRSVRNFDNLYRRNIRRLSAVIE